MPGNYKILKQLIDLWESYEDIGEHLNLSDFAEWIMIRVKQNPELNIRAINKSMKMEKNGYGHYIENLDEPTRFLEYISRISRYHEFYIKKFLAELPINSRLEFLFLQTVNDLEHSKKTDLINIHLVDYSTGMDTIKRLINNDLLIETQVENDKRVKLLQITLKGKEILSFAARKLNDEKKMFLACISINKWKKTMPVLEEINDFHFLIFLKHYDKSSSELLNLMDSLKYLYK